MFFEIDGKTYRVKFSRTDTTTYANLIRVEPDAGLVETNIVGIASLYHKDKFVKSTGRKIALAHLLERMNEISAGDTEPEFTLTREDRANIWAEYFKTHKK